MQKPKTLIRKGFDTENQLVKAILFCLRKSANRSFRAELELDAGVGFADIVLYNRRHRTTRELKLLATVPPQLAPLLDPTTSSKIRTGEDLAAALGREKPAAHRLIREFEKLGLISPHPSNSLLPLIERTPFQTIISIEAKLSDWSRALVQAYRNLQFADESWVVLDHCFHKAAIAKIERFQRSGVGLASVDIDGSLYIHFVAPNAPSSSATKRWHAEAALARRVWKSKQITTEH